MLTFARTAMRTRFEIVIADDRDAASLNAAAEEAFDEIERVEAQLSAYRTDSELSFINANAANEPVVVETRFFRLLQCAAELTERTRGAFDMTVGPLLKLWGISNENEPKMPSSGEIAAALEITGFNRVVKLDESMRTIQFLKCGARLDPGSIGKGWALDGAAEVLRDAGIKSALLHGGTSTAIAIGSPPGETAWKIAIQHPETKKLIAEIGLCDRSMSVSGIHGKMRDTGAMKIGHVIDPRTGQPVSHTLLAAVACESAADSDALSTALLVGNRKNPGVTDLLVLSKDTNIELGGAWKSTVNGVS